MRPSAALLGAAPAALAVLLVAYVLAPGPGLEGPGFVALPQLSIERVDFESSEIRALVRNTGPVGVTVVQADVNDRIQPAAVEPDGSLERLESALVRIPYEWNAGEPYSIGVTIGDGTRFERTVDAAVPALRADAPTLSYFAFVGLLVGAVPVLIGVAWRPYIARLGDRARSFFLAVTLGLLVFLAADTAEEALATSAEWGLDEGFNGALMALTAAALAFLGVRYASSLSQRRAGRAAPMAVAAMITLGIALHNFGEGLAIGAAVGLGAASFTSFLIVGLALHNLTEGIAIAAPLARVRAGAPRLAALGLAAGLPVIAGTWAGGFAFSPPLAVALLGAAAGAVVQVAVSLAEWMRSEGMALSAPPALAGAGLGMAVLYAVSILA